MNSGVSTGHLPAGLPPDVLGVFRHFFTAEMTTLAADGTPITWPVLPIFWEARGLFVTFTSIGLPMKAYNIRRSPETAMLFSDSTGSDLENPPVVLVQGTAKAGDRPISSSDETDPGLIEAVIAQGEKMMQRQPAIPFYLSSPITRYLMDWYFMRLQITIEPRTITWWEGGDYRNPPQKLELIDVA